MRADHHPRAKHLSKWSLCESLSKSFSPPCCGGDDVGDAAAVNDGGEQQWTRCDQ